MQLGNITVTDQAETVYKLTMLLWGKPACGKTVLASTAPGKKLWLLFDPNGTASITQRDDVVIADFSTYKYSKIADFKQGSSLERDLNTLIKDNGIETVVIDSITSFGQLAMRGAIAHPASSKGQFTSTLENPGISAYGTRTALVIDFCAMVELAARSNGCHFIVIAHDMETYNTKGEVESITMSLRGGAAEAVPPRISEIWRMDDDGKKRTVFVRNHGMHRPMRTRMFLTPDGLNKFIFTYDQDKQTGLGISDYYDAWKASGYKKINLPT